MDGDNVQLLIAPDTIIGGITGDVAVDDVWLNVQPSVIANTCLGYWLELYDGTNSEDMGRVVEIDSDNNKVKMENAATQTFIPATPTYVRQTAKMVPHLYLQSGCHICLGECMIKSSYIPANLTLKIRYNNISGTAKVFSVIFQLKY